MNELIRFAGEAIVFLGASYLLFFRKYAEELGTQTAQLATIAKKTEEVEKVREGFNQNLELFKKDLQLQFVREIEPLKAILSRKNIKYQIYHGEFARLRFERFDQLYARLYDLQKYSKTNLFYYAIDKEFQEKKKEFLDRYQLAEDAYYLCLLYLDDNITQSVLDLLNQCYTAFTAFIDYFYSDQNREIYKNFQPSTSLIDKNIQSFDKFQATIQKFPELLRNIRDQVHKSIDDDNGA